MNKIKKIFKVDTYFQLVIIFIVFAITGSLTLVCANYLINLLEIGWIANSSFFSLVLKIFVTLPIYQILLLSIGSIFGQFRYFYNLEKKILKRFRIIK